MKKIMWSVIAYLILLAGTISYALFLAPRPPDTTDPTIFAGDASKVDYCDLADLDSSGLLADDIPKAYTPECGWTIFPMPVLAGCTEPLADDVTDMRGLWLAHSGLEGHLERIEQCGNRTVVTSSGIIHDFRTDGSLKNGSRDIEPPSCMNTYVSIDFDEDGTMNFHPFGLPVTMVTRRIDGAELVWTYPAIEDEVRMRRICELPR